MKKKHDSRRIDLTGMKFGDLTVIREAENVDGLTAWVCRCKCGKVITVKTKYLRAGKTVSCGCRKKKGLRGVHYVDGTCIEMIKSDHVRRNSKSGVTGVYYDPAHDKWRAEIMLGGRRHYLGRFMTLKEARDARMQAKEIFHGSEVRKFEQHV